jgi:hypothetical protein
VRFIFASKRDEFEKTSGFWQKLSGSAGFTGFPNLVHF